METFKKLAVWFIILVISLPALLIFSEGQNGEFTIWNVIGLAWGYMLVVLCRRFLYEPTENE